MALSYPLSLASFMDLLPVQNVDMRLTEGTVGSRRADGEIVRTGIASRLWEATVTVDRLPYRTAERFLSTVRTLEDARGSFIFSPPHADRPAAMATAPNGAIQSVNANRRAVAFGSLAPGYVLSPGDFWSCTTGTGDGLRYHMYQLTEGATANGSGVTVQLDVTPDLHPAITTALEVVFLKPRFKAVLMPGALSGATIRHVLAEPFSFTLRQTYR
jgi:hypothetical protein